MSMDFDTWTASQPYSIERRGRDEITITVPGIDRVWHLHAGPSCPYDGSGHRADLGMSTWTIEGWNRVKAVYEQHEEALP